MKFSELSSHSTGIILIPILLVVLLSWPVTGVASPGWQTVNVNSWAQIDLPPGWTYGAVENSTAKPDAVYLEALSPDQEARLQYVFERNLNSASPGELKRSQDRMMGDRGFCECQYEPQFVQTEGSTTMKQTYFKGTDQGAVVCSAAYPGWGRYQYSLIMSGASAVSDYYEDMPDKLAEHIRPVSSGNETESG